MTTYLYNILLTAGGDRMAATDPHGWTLTLISVSVVFLALIILYFVYSISGGIFSGKFKGKAKPRKSKSKDQDLVAAAIALALDAEISGVDPQTQAAIALALHLRLNDSVHDVEPGFITLSRASGPEWASKQLNFRKLPKQ